ncbi:hypothetical protein HanXRQr2_Chr08g0338501 [Helianthus annuus]|uniref:Uncharacterized protein n=1 Tax=Helianthus annuus TaxID=4232 RepID=A0A251U686_HELAN|nr:hypothetical protein HanXRQr2_Chr08g0338501 [Helianthus annuus]KAJ0553484.1 hypothetical protein HanHA89_Chr08g0296901 [Helianthus annuus]KAJ0722399.1 hypothetical protein HanOQP8_Chr08g0286201 [Helianthus annuus]
MIHLLSISDHVLVNFVGYVSQWKSCNPKVDIRSSGNHHRAITFFPFTSQVGSWVLRPRNSTPLAVTLLRSVNCWLNYWL